MEGWTKLAVMALSQLGVIPFGPVQRSSPAPLLDGLLGAAVACVLALLAVLAAVGCLCAGLWAHLLPQVGPVWTPVLVAVALLVLCLLLLLLARSLVKRREPPPPPPAALPSLDPEALLAEVQGLVAKHKVPALLAAIVAGMVVGTSGSHTGSKK